MFAHTGLSAVLVIRYSGAEVKRLVVADQLQPEGFNSPTTFLVVDTKQAALLVIIVGHTADPEAIYSVPRDTVEAK